jgi:nucleotide-binding universal stress UspA family protein
MAAPVLAAADPLRLDVAPARFGALIAGHTGAPLQVASVYADESAIEPLTAGQLGEPLAADGDELERVLAELRRDGTDAEPLPLVATSAPRGLALAAVQLGAGLLVVGPGSTAARLLAGAPCAVALAPGEPRQLATIGVGFVDTAEGRAALKGAHALARRAGARLRVLVAVQPRAWLRRVTADELRARAEAAAEAAASGLLGAPVDIDVAVHEPAELLLGVAHELDLLVAGARGYGPTPATLLGGVTRRLVTEARCPVIVCARAAPVPLEALLA